MPWSTAKVVEFGDKIIPSLLTNNLSADGRGRFAFAHGGRVQCTRKHDKKQGRNDFSLALRNDGFDVTETFWWHNVNRFPRPLLVLGTSISPVTGQSNVQVWDTRNGRGNRVFSVKLGSEENKTHFARGLGSVLTKNKKNVLCVGLNTGEVHAYEINNKRSALERYSTLRGLSGPVTCIAGDRNSLPQVAACDERGNILLWTHSEAGWECKFKYREARQYYCALGLKGDIIAAGCDSGVVGFFHVRRGEKVTEIVTNAKTITCLDVHETQDLVLVGGEDCRVAVLTLPTDGLEQVQAMLSVCQNGMVVGGRFACTRPNSLDIVLLLWERNYLMKYEYNGA